MDEQFAAQFGTGYITALILDWLKQKPWFPFMKVDTAQLNRFFAVLVAFAVSAGLHYTFDPDTRVLSITIPTMYDFMHRLTDIAIQFGMQDISYHLVVKERTRRQLEEAKPTLVIVEPVVKREDTK